MRRIFALVLFAAVVVLGGGDVVFAGNCNGINNCNVFKKEVIEQKISEIDDREFHPGLFFNIFKRVYGDDDTNRTFDVGLQYEVTGIFDNADQDNHQLMVGGELRFK